MTNTIASALTPDEWELVPDDVHVSAEPISDVADIGFFDRYNDWTVLEDRHAIAALCLHGQPFGFTRKDVEFLRDVVTAIANPLAMDIRYGVDDEEHMTRLADKIESLLPPENAP